MISIPKNSMPKSPILKKNSIFKKNDILKYSTVDLRTEQLQLKAYQRHFSLLVPLACTLLSPA
jgi:hypothetical protein